MYDFLHPFLKTGVLTAKGKGLFFMIPRFLYFKIMYRRKEVAHEAGYASKNISLQYSEPVSRDLYVSMLYPLHLTPYELILFIFCIFKYFVEPKASSLWSNLREKSHASSL